MSERVPTLRAPNFARLDSVSGDESVAVPSIYFNGFSVALSNSDVHSVLLLDGIPIARLNMSYTTAKTMAKLFGQTMKTFEEVTEHDIMTSDTVAEALQKRANAERAQQGGAK